MTQTFEIPFAKFHGLSNDFIVTRGNGFPPSLPELARAITARHTGIGADGFIVVLAPDDKRHDARIRFFNPDGSEPEMSGNGIRCAGAFLLGNRRTRGAATLDVGSRGNTAQATLKIETLAGVKTLELIRAERGIWIFEVGMGAPILTPREIPFEGGDSSRPLVGYELRTSRGLLPVTVTSMGNPHCTVFVTDFNAVDGAGLGGEIERNKIFPNRTNVEFVKVISRREIEVQFWERGVGETMSSGTGSCGAVVASILNGLTGRKVRVRTLAGDLEVKWPANGEVKLTGPVERSAQGTYYFRDC
jgi:diaminopimelate epimerase